jgi:signal transduction histidine kinase
VVRRHEVLIDAAVPVLVGGVIVAGDLLHGGDAARPLPVALGVAAAGVLWARRRWPALTLAVSGSLVAVSLHVAGSAATLAVIAPAVALYSLALTRGRRLQLLAGVAAVCAVLAADLLHPGRPGVLQTLGHALLVAIPLLAAEQVRTHRLYLRAMTERLRLAEEAREREAEQRAERERMRIARELHDVVAHTLTEINVQAAAAAEQLEHGAGRAALERIEQASHGAIGELRAILGVLRDPGGQGEPPRCPNPGIADIAELIERARGTGLDARLDVDGERPDSISDAASLAAYRIVQESLTNARRHAPGAAVRVKLRFEPGGLSLAIENGGAVTPNGHHGTIGVGLTGMRERATALGGTLHAAPAADGFRVDALLPYLPGG